MIIRLCIFLGLYLLLSPAFEAQAQNYNNPGGVIQTCSGTFYDTGGNGGSYGHNQLITTTICTNVAGQCVSVNFTTFNIENGYDFLMIYDGPSASSPLIGTYTGTSSPGTVTASMGCLTFVFESDFSIANAGWRAQISCTTCPPPPPCTGITPACASPVPDICANACNLGTLTSPPACPSSASATNVYCLNNIGATPATPYLALGGCQPSGANMPNPAADVWYSFIASSNIIDVRIVGLNTPSVGFYEGTNCNTFLGRGCGVGSYGSLSATFQPVVPGRQYYLRISGGDTTDTGNFTLTITGRNDCDPCLINYNITATPPPVNAVYSPGDRIHFCMTVSQWSPTAVNWIHGVVPTFGPGWDLSSLTVFPPPSCDGYGSWAWYNSVTSSATGQVAGPGFFYESTQGCPAACNANTPGDNYGDNCTGNVNFVFCWDITVSSVPPAAHGDNLNVSINTYGDGETGSWTSFACASDPLTEVYGTLSDCRQPGLRTKDVSCNGGQDGRIIANGRGIGPFTYTWRDTAGAIIQTAVTHAPDTLLHLPAGTYTVEVTDGLQCFSANDVVVAEPPAVVVSLNVTDISCFGQNDGSIIATASGGIAPYEYSLDGNNFQASNIFNGLSDGTYTITVRDDSACTGTTTAIIAEPALLNITLDSVHHAACVTATNGAIYTTVSGGIAPYSFQWSNSDSTEDILNLTGNNYLLTVTDGNLCTAHDTFIVNTGTGITISATSTDVTCNGSPDGTAAVTVAGGTLPFDYEWSNGDSLQMIGSITAGFYSVTVTDAHHCMDIVDVTVSEPAQLSLSGTATDATCATSNDGSVQLSAAGGIAPYQFSLDGIQFQSSGNFNSVPSGNYQTVVRDSNHCTATTTLLVNTPSLITTSITTTDVTCFNSNDGTALVAATGPNRPFTYSWNIVSSDSAITGLAAGSYTVTVTNTNGCFAIDTAMIGTPAILEISGMQTDVLCHGRNTGTLDVTVSGGTPGYTYQWNDGPTTASRDSLIAGSYVLVVADNNYCTETVSFTIDQPAPLMLTTTGADVICNGQNNGVARVTATGGNAPYTYLWDAEAASQTTSSAVNLGAGAYTVTVTDVHYCSDTAAVVIAEPQLLELHLDTVIHPVCTGQSTGTILVSATGGNGVYDFTWNTGPISKSNNPSGLTAGDYSCTVTDANGCADTLSATVVDPPLFTAMILPADTTIIYGDSVQLHAVHTPASVEPAYLWEPVSEMAWCITPCAAPIVSPASQTIFTVELIDPNTNCVATAEALVHVEYDNEIYPPNAFTPDGDGVNDEFEIFFGPSMESMEYHIFNRWGEKLFYSGTPGNFWDGTYRGKAMSPGVYIYTVRVHFQDGQNKFYKGSFTLLR